MHKAPPTKYLIKTYIVTSKGFHRLPRFANYYIKQSLYYYVAIYFEAYDTISTTTYFDGYTIHITITTLCNLLFCKDINKQYKIQQVGYNELTHD